MEVLVGSGGIGGGDGEVEEVGCDGECYVDEGDRSVCGFEDVDVMGEIGGSDCKVVGIGGSVGVMWVGSGQLGAVVGGIFFNFLVFAYD